MLAADALRVALVTTHLPLSAVPAAITPASVGSALRITAQARQEQFGIAEPRIQVLGLNPHAGEGGHLGHEDDDIIAPAMASLGQPGVTLLGPVPADTAFTPRALADCDAVVAMYHDQGLPVLKHAGFGRAVAYLRMQVEAGVDAVQLFDTWGGILHPADYAKVVLPCVKRIMDGLKDSGVPRIYFLKGSAPYLDLVTTLDVEALGMDWTMDMARSLPLMKGYAVQGNLDPLALFGSTDEIRSRALDICRAGTAAPGHVFNLGHGIDRRTDPDQLARVVDRVHAAPVVPAGAAS